jgi:predicted membrane protein
MEIRIAAATPAGPLTGGVITVASTGATSATLSVSGTVNAAPSLTVSPASLSGFTATQGTASAAQTFTVSGANLTGNVTVTAPSGFEVSNGGGSYLGSLTLTQSGGTLANSTISVRLTAANVGSPSGNITVSSGGASSKTVGVSGTVVPPPAITVTGTLAAFTATQGTASAAQTFTVSGANLIGNVTVTAPANFEVSTDGTNFFTSRTLTQISGSVASTTISVRLTAAAPNGPVSGNVLIDSSGAPESTLAVLGVVGSQPAIAVASDFSAFSATQGAASAAQTFTVSGANLTGNVIITAPANFEVSTDGTNFAASRSLASSAGTLAATTVSVRLAATAPAGAVSGRITVSSPGVAEQTLAVDGEVVPPPTLSVSASFSAFAADPDILPGRVEPQGSVPAGYEKVSFSQLAAGGRGFFRVQASVPEPSSADDYAAWAAGYSSAELQDQTADYDGDGFVNFNEYAFGTDPTKGNNSLSSVRLESGNVVVTFLRRAGLTYSVLKAAALSGGNSVLQTTQGTASAAQTFTVSGTNLTGDVTVTAPAGFEVSAGGSYSVSLNIVPVGGTLATTTVSVRLAASTAEGSPSGNITISSPGAATKTVAISGTASAPPSLTVTGDLAPFSTTQGTASDPQTFTVGGTRLAGNVTVTAPSGCEVSRDGTVFATSLALTPSGGNLPTATVFARVAATATAGLLTGQIQVASSGASPSSVGVSGEVVAVPRIDVSGSLVSFSASAGTASPEQTLLISGANLTANVIVEAPLRFEVSSGAGSPFATSITLAPSSGSVNRSVLVRAAASPSGAYSGDLTITSLGANRRVLGLSATVSPPPSLAIDGSLTPFSATFGSASTAQSFAVTAANLSADITVAAPAGFELSLDGVTFLSTQNIPRQNSSAAATVYVRLGAGTAVGPYAGLISLASTGTESRSLPASGTIVPVPLLGTSGVPAAMQTVAGSSSSSQTFTVSGNHLVGAATLTAPAGFELSGQRKPFAQTITLSPSFGTLNESIMVRIARSDTPGVISGIISATSPGAATVHVAVEGSVLRRPLLSMDGSLTAFSAARNQPSPSQMVAISGSNLSATVSVTAPSDFQVSADNVSFASRVQFNPSGGALSARNVWIRLAPNSTAGSYGGDVTLSSTGATTRVLSVMGTVN